MKTSYIAFLCLCMFMFAGTITAQDLHIYYDAQTNKSRYEYAGKPVTKPKVKKGGNIFVHVENFNNYLYDLEVATEEKEIKIATSSFSPLPNSLFGGGGISDIYSGGNDYDPLGMDSGVDEGYDDLSDLDFGGGGFAEGSASAKRVKRLKADFDALALDMTKTEKQLKSISNQVDGYKEAQIIKRMALTETEKLRYNPNLSPSQIKKLSTEYLQTALEADSPDDIDLSALIVQSDGRKNLKEKLNTLDSKHREYKTQVGQLESIGKELEGYKSEDGEVAMFYHKVDKIHENAMLVENNVKQQREEIVSLLEAAEEEDLETHAALRYAFEEITTNDFSEVYRTNAAGDELELDLNLSLKDSVASRAPTAPNNVEMAAINVPVFGGLKINASVGLSFGQFFSRPQNYYIRDSIILAEEQDAFNPYLTSFIHFYPQSVGMISIGGAVGVGLPMSSDDGLQSTTFFLGPSLIIGKGERIVINAGIMGGKVKRLSQGFEVGDVFHSDADIVPTHHPYELGGFVGVSFNLIR